MPAEANESSTQRAQKKTPAPGTKSMLSTKQSLSNCVQCHSRMQPLASAALRTASTLEPVGTVTSQLANVGSPATVVADRWTVTPVEAFATGAAASRIRAESRRVFRGFSLDPPRCASLV